MDSSKFYKLQQKQEAIRLRVEENLGLQKIADRLSIAKSTACLWLKDYPIKCTELAKKLREGGHSMGGWNKHDRGEPSKYYRMVKTELTSASKGQIAETAVALRLSILGLKILTNMFDGGVADYVVLVSSGRLAKLQVKWAHQHHNQSGTFRGRPCFKLTCMNGNGKVRYYKQGDFDFLVGYDLYSDVAYVHSWNEVSTLHKMISAKDENAERWDKLLQF
jgi:hypothetical protein